MRLNCSCSAAYGPHAHCSMCGDPIHTFHPCTRCARMAQTLGEDGVRWVQDVVKRAINDHAYLLHPQKRRKG